MIRAILIYLIVIFSYSCNKKDDTTEGNLFRCSFKELENFIQSKESENGNTVTIDAVIKGNIKKLIEIEGEVSFSDSIIVNSAKEKSTRFANYSTGFIEKHNGIVQILCSIEKEFLDTILNNYEKQYLRKDLWDKRSVYFNFLIQEGTKQKSKSTKITDEKRAKFYKEKIEISLYVDVKKYDLSSTIINGEKVSFISTSTQNNLRFYVQENNFTLQLTTITGKTCTKQYSLNGHNTKYVIQFSEC